MKRVDAIREALALAEAEGDLEQQLVLGLALGEALQKEGDFDGALAAYEEVGATVSAEHLSLHVEAALRVSALTLQLGAFEQALSSLKQAEALKGFAALPAETRAQVHHNGGLSLARLGSHVDAVAAYQDAMSAWSECTSDVTQAKATTELALGEALLFGGDASHAVDVLSSGWSSLKDQKGFGVRDRAAVHELLGEACSRAGAHNDAMSHIRQSVRFWEVAKDLDRTLGASLRLAELLLADDEAGDERLIEASVLFERYAEESEVPAKQLYGWVKLAETLELAGHLARASIALVRAAGFDDAPDVVNSRLCRAAELAVAAVPEAPPQSDAREPWVQERVEALEWAEALYQRAARQDGVSWARRVRLEALIEAARWSEALSLLTTIQEQEPPDDVERRVLLLAHAARLHLKLEQIALARRCAVDGLTLLEADEVAAPELREALTLLIKSLS